MEWRVCSVSNLYEVSNTGDVRNRRTLKVLTPSLNRKGYPFVCIWTEPTGIQGMRGESRTVTVHRLVADAFLGPLPEGLTTNHKNGRKTDNRASNLEYLTNRENIAHAFRIGLRKRRWVARASA